MDSHEVRRAWNERTGAFSPEYYANYGADDRSRRVAALVEREVGRDAAVLEIGCSSGRHLAHLHGAGFRDLTGIEPNTDARDVMREHYPALHDDVAFHGAGVEEVVTAFDDDAFDAVYSVETLQHIHPDEDWIYDELHRVTDGVMVTAENEHPADGTPHDAPGGVSGDAVTVVDGDVPLYHRDWSAVLGRVGFEQIEMYDDDRLTTRLYRS